jgi:hypothetical protein
MSDTEQRGLWVEHLRDEATEHRAQQRAAGASHEPLERPLPHSADDVQTAALVERERCAAIADAWASEEALQAAFSDFTEWELRAAIEVARAIARGIRGEPLR